MVTRAGIEGGPVYAIGAAARDTVEVDGRCVVVVDLRPALTVEQLADRLQRRRPKDSTSTWLRRTWAWTPSPSGCCGSRAPVPCRPSPRRWPRW